MKGKKKDKVKYIDDGRTIANMNVEGMKWYIPEEKKENNRQLSGLKLTLKERWAMIKAAYIVVLPIVLYFILGFGTIILLIYLWLNY